MSPYCHVDPPEEGWGEWDDEVKDKKVSFMVSQIEKGHSFKKEEWPGGISHLPLITHFEKKPDVVHRKHIVPCRKQVSATLRLNQSSSKSRQPKRAKERKQARKNKNELSDLKAWVESQLLSLKEDHALQLKKLEARINRLVKKLKVLKFRRTRKFNTRLSALFFKKPRSVSKHLPTPTPPAASPPSGTTPVDSPSISVEDVGNGMQMSSEYLSPQSSVPKENVLSHSPVDILVGDHDWYQYCQVSSYVFLYV